MSLRTRLFTVLFVILAGAAIVIWYGIKPSYEDAIFEERLALVTEYQQQRIRESEIQLFFWLKVRLELQEYDPSDRIQLETIFSTYTSLFPDFLALDIRNLDNGNHVTLQNPRMPDLSLDRIDNAMRLTLSEEQALRSGFTDDQNFFFLQHDYTHENQRLRIITVFEASKLIQIMIQNVLRGDAFSVIWKPDSTAIGTRLDKHYFPGVGPVTTY